MATSDQLRRKVLDLAKKRGEEERKAADEATKEAKKKAEAASLRARASKASSDLTARTNLRQADTAEKAALAAAKKSADHRKRAAKHSAEEAAASKALAAAVTSEAAAAERTRKRDIEAAERASKREQRAERSRTHRMISDVESRMSQAIAELRPPRVELLRILYLTAASDGDIRVDEEVRRVKLGVRAATHRDLVQIEHLPAATPSDLLDGLGRFRPHVVHFSGHGAGDALVFDTGTDVFGPGHAVTAGTFARAVGAVDEPPQVVVLNACHTAEQLEGLVAVVPVAIGMRESVEDSDAMAFAARFYTAVADGQSVGSAFELAKVQMAFGGLEGDVLPILAARPGVDATEVRLVVTPPDAGS